MISPGFGAAVTGIMIAGVTLLLTAPALPSLRSMSPRRRLYWISIGGSVLVGVVIGVLLSTDHAAGADATKLFTTGPLSPEFAFVAAVLWFIGVGAACLIYHRAIDDHEERAWLWAGLAGWYAFILPAPAWWVLHRAALAPAVDAMLLFILSMIVNALVWLWLKFR